MLIGVAPHVKTLCHEAQLCSQSCCVASLAPSAMAWNLAQTTVGWTSGAKVACDENPQSLPAITFSRPTSLDSHVREKT